MKKHLLLLVLFIGLTAQAQSELNAYKYIVIPSKFDFQKEANEHGLNLLLKYKFQQLGFESYLDTDDLPQELRIILVCMLFQYCTQKAICLKQQ